MPPPRAVTLLPMAEPADIARRGAQKGAETVAAWTLRRAILFVLGPTLAGLAGTNLVTAFAYAAIVQGRTFMRRSSGELSDHAFRIESVRNVGWGIGAFFGMSIGAFLGSVVPLVGTLVLSMVLGGLGGLAGAGLGRLLGWTVMGRFER